MLSTDGKLSGAHDMLTHTLLSAQWEWKAPRHGGVNAERNTRWCNEAFGLAGHPGRMADSWEVNLQRLLGFIPFGWSMAEPVFYYQDGSWWLKGLYDREPESFSKWEWDERGDLAGMYQSLTWPGFSETFTPASKLLILTLHKTGQNLHGRGMLRPCWPWYQLKLHAMKQLGFGLERWAVPMPLVRGNWPDAQQAGMTRADYEDELADARTTAQRIQSREAAYASASKFVDMDVLGEGTFDPGAALGVINQANQEMLTAWTMQFMELGLGDVGSRSVGMIHENSFRRSAINLLDRVANAIGGAERPGGGLAAQMLRWQFYHPSRVPAEDMPVLEHHGLKIEALAEALGQLPALVAADILKKEQLAGATTDLFGLPHATSVTSPADLTPPQVVPVGGRPKEGSTIR